MKITRIKHAYYKNENDGVGEPCIPRRVLISDVRAVLFYDLIGIQFDDSDLLAAQRADERRLSAQRESVRSIGWLGIIWVQIRIGWVGVFPLDIFFD